MASLPSLWTAKRRTVSPVLLFLAGSARLGQQFASIQNGIRVALFGEKELAMVSEIQLPGVARDQRIKMGDFSGRLRPQNSPERCASSWREPKVPET